MSKTIKIEELAERLENCEPPFHESSLKINAQLDRDIADAAEALRALSTTLDKCLAAGFVTPEGEVRKVDTRGWDCGNPDRAVPLPTYADGSLWMMGEDYYTWHEGEVVEFFSTDHALSWTQSGWVVRCGDGEIELSQCYPTPEAAEAAKVKGGGQ